MPLSASLNVGVSALKTFAEGIQVTSNNIANVNTVGYKVSRAQYSDTFSNLLKPLVPNTTNTGAKVPPTQIGGGVQIESVQAVFSQGTIQNSANNSDLAIAGSGFFLVKDPLSGKVMATRSGNFRLDADGYFVTQQGLRVQGAYGAKTVVQYNTVTGAMDVKGVQDNKMLSALSLSAASPIISVPSTLGLSMGMVVSGPGIPYGTKISSLTSTTITLDQNPTVTTSVPVNPAGSLGLIGDSVYADLSAADVTASTYSQGYPIVADGLPSGTRVVSVNEANSTVPAAGSLSSTPSPAVTVGSNYAMIPTADAAKLMTNMKVTLSDNIVLRVVNIDVAAGKVTFDKNLTVADASLTFTPTLTLTDAALRTTSVANTAVSLIKDATQKFPALSFGDLYVPALNVGDVRVSFEEGADKDYTFVDEYNQPLSGLNLAEARRQVPQLRTFNVGTSGEISIILSNGQTFNAGNVLIQAFKDPGALIREGSNMFSGIDNAGKFNGEFNAANIQRLIPGTAGLGVINGGSLELSNVDLGEEFSNMIITQRAFQAGSRVISTTDSMMEEVVNLKR